jgi:hypothetical protein
MFAANRAVGQADASFSAPRNKGRRGLWPLERIDSPPFLRDWGEFRRPGPLVSGTFAKISTKSLQIVYTIWYH